MLGTVRQDQVDVEGTGDKVSYSGNNQITETFEFDRKANLRWSHVPLDGETRVDDALMEAIEPFDFKGLIPYDYRYLPGFYADRYDQSPQDLAARATKRGMEGIDKAIKDSLKGKYDRYRIKKNMSKINSMDAYYALLPVWFLSYKYRNKFYYFTMNGQTGEVARHTFKFFHPKFFVINNLYRDQMTRNGHPEWIKNIIGQAIYDDMTLILNSDDPLVASFGKDREGTIYFGAGILPGDTPCLLRK